MEVGFASRLRKTGKSYRITVPIKVVEKYGLTLGALYLAKIEVGEPVKQELQTQVPAPAPSEVPEKAPEIAPTEANIQEIPVPEPPPAQTPENGLLAA